ncbi:WbqC family protein [Aliikangiella coralliicola]|uniref:WbqC family protein n=1 Tax=Aliikangiella coralliicola TaxID=2592383 RepID=A0A545TSL9_9GAMM|nr:WbqC family protein [Aliikangiella coralliicola]TQV80216.1 WbqC family protein [Aliikangiella coralliicola]
MLISIIQPCFIPWLGYFEQMAVADLFVYMDDVKYSRQNWRNNNRLLCQSVPKNISIPVQKTNKYSLINQVLISNNRDWRKEFLNKVMNWYRRAPYFEEIFDLISNVVLENHDKLVCLNYKLNSAIALYLGIKTPIKLTSMVPRSSNDKVTRIIEIVKYFNADVLYDGKSAANFIDKKVFIDSGITVIFQDYKHTPYRQNFSESFVPYMSVLDLLMNEGPSSLDIILSSPLPGELVALKK